MMILSLALATVLTHAADQRSQSGRSRSRSPRGALPRAPLTPAGNQAGIHSEQCGTSPMSGNIRECAQCQWEVHNREFTYEEDVFKVVHRDVFNLDELNDRRNDEGELALHAAVKCNHTKLVAVLLARGANPNAYDAHGRTALHHIDNRYDRAEDKEMIEILVSGGADPRIAALGPFIGLEGSNRVTNLTPRDFALRSAMYEESKGRDGAETLAERSLAMASAFERAERKIRRMEIVRDLQDLGLGSRLCYDLLTIIAEFADDTLDEEAARRTLK